MIGADAAAPAEPGEERLADGLPLTTAGLVTGAAVAVGTRPGDFAIKAAERVSGALEAVVVGGLHAGAGCPLPAGAVLDVGRSPGRGLRIPDPEVSRRHARIEAAADGCTAALRDEGSANGTRRGAWRLEGDAVLGGDGEPVGMGESMLAVRPPVGGDAELTASAAAGVRLVNRPPRIAVPDRLPELLVPVAPAEPRGLRFPWAATLLPALLCGALYFVLPRGFAGYLLIMLVLSPLMAIANLVSDRRSGRRDHRAERVAYVRARAAYEKARDEAVAAEEATARAAHPDPAAVAARAGVPPGAGAPAAQPSSALWERRPGDADFLRLRVGLADRPARFPQRVDPSAGARAADAATPEQPIVRDVPVTVDLAAAGVLGVAAPRPAAAAIARALLAQVAVLHSPAELGLVVITGRDAAAGWDWATWLPHTLPGSGAFSCTRMIATDAAQAEARLAELRRLVDERAAERRGALRQGPPTGRSLLVVLDGVHALRDLAGLGDLLVDGPASGVYALCLDAEETALADECSATLVASNGSGTRATLRCRGVPPVEDILVDGLVDTTAAAVGHALAPLRPLGERGGDSALPDTARLLDLADLDSCTPEAIRARWARSRAGRSTTALLGIGADGPVSVDLTRDGPHALVAGTSGSGKSELLQTLVASLAIANTPDALTFVLVDYKGGSAFAASADLPHCVGLVTDLDGHQVGRALESLSAELRRREELFAAADAKDIEDYWTRTGARLPRLVIVVDEFASMIEELPEFVPGIVGIGMRGRSLGVHVVLATQRPGGAVSADLRANLNLRICLRVTSPSESVDVIETADAARVPVRLPGRAYLLAGGGELRQFQTARAGWPVPSDPAAQDAAPAVQATIRRIESLGRAPAGSRTSAQVESSERTDLTELVTAICKAADDAGLATPPRPWLPPLPDRVALADLGSCGAEGLAAAVLGLVDRPAAQSQEPFVLDLARTGPVAIAGMSRSGRSTALRAIAAGLAASASPADLHLYAADFGDQALAPLAAMPHCGAVVDGADAARFDRLLTTLREEIGRRQRRTAHRPHVVVLIDRLEVFLSRYVDVDGGRLVDRLEDVLRTGPGAGVTVVLTTDRTGFQPRIASAVAGRLVLRQASPDDAAVFGLDPRALPRTMPPGRGLWADGGQEIQVAQPDDEAFERLGPELTTRWDGLAEHLLPRRVDALPEHITLAEAEALRRTPRPQGPAACAPAVGGDRLGPADIDLTEAGGAFLVCGPQRSGRSTALASIALTLAGRSDRTLPVVLVAPRPSPLRELGGEPGVDDVLHGNPADIAMAVADAAAAGPVALVVDDGELLIDPALAHTLESVARDARDTGSILVAAATTEDVQMSFGRGWLAAVRRPRSGLLLNPVSTEGEVFGLTLSRYLNRGWPPGRALLVRRGDAVQVQVAQPGTGRGPEEA
ncbi:FtsK/SpoIIIE domain-containing protein [Actinomadura decatromicini]|uniref:FtsK/SpoIIIE domain-containing protein n=1 Tax=Actinomadura decatromicini TaxID=2604572 RepID=UPI001CA310EB|nr:FtsK/SpoIIIE domain-containing protein [Actinomadura decatromicini]